MSRKASAQLIRAGLLVLTLFVSSCATADVHSVIALPNGYYLQQNKAGQPSLVKRSGGTVIPGPIAAYKVYRDWVTGALGATAGKRGVYTNDLPFHGGPDTRYFVLDTSSGKLESGLDEATWKSRLTALGAPPNLEIYAPLLPD